MLLLQTSNRGRGTPVHQMQGSEGGLAKSEPGSGARRNREDRSSPSGGNGGIIGTS